MRKYSHLVLNTLWPCLILINAQRLIAQSPTYVNYSIPEGLPSSETYDLHQDKQGFIWVATDNGIARLDGHEIQTYHIAEGLIDPVIFGFYEDEKNRLWLRSYSGKLSYLENGVVKKYRWNDKLYQEIKGEILNTICIDGEDLHFSNSQFIGAISRDGMVTSTKQKKRSLWFKTIGKGAIWGSTGIINEIKVNDKIFNIAPAQPSAFNKGLCVAYGNKNLYFGSSNNIFRYDGKEISKVFTSDAPIISLYVDIQNNVWVGYKNKGVQRFRNENFSSSETPNFLDNLSVTKVLCDNDEGYWFSTLEKGIFHSANLAIEKISYQSESKVTAAIAARKWVLTGDQKGLIKKYDPKTKQLLGVGSLKQPILALFESNTDQLWAAANRTYTLKSDLTIQNLVFLGAGYKFLQDKNNYIWLAGGNRVNRFDQELRVKSYRRPFITRSYLIQDSLFFLSQQTGMEIEGRNFKRVLKPKALDNYKITNFLSLNDSLVMISTVGSGFLIFNVITMKYKTFNSSNQFIANNIFAAVKTDTFLCLSTEKGIVVIDLKSLINGKIIFQLLAQKDFLMNQKINHLVYYKPNIWAFSDDGFFGIPESVTSRQIQKPTFYLKNISVNNSSVPSNSLNINLQHFENNIGISFGFISFNNQNILIRYRLNDKDPWLQSTQRNLQFYALEPGKYNLNIEYSVDNIQWIPTPIINFKIAPPWWRTWYFIAACFVLVFLLSYLLFKLRLSSLRQKHLYLTALNNHQQELILAEIETLERERSRIAKDLHDSIGTNLTAIKMSTNTVLKKHNDPNSTIIEEQLQNTIHEIKNIIYDLVPPGLERYGLLAGIKSYIEKMRPTLEVTIDFYLFGKEIKDPKISILSFRIIQELISNSLKHSHAKTITLHINSFKESLNIVYEDNGIGFNVDQHNKGSGLLNIESRIQSIKGSIQVETGDFGVSYLIDIPITEQ